jgi:hypothetical protein
MNPSKEHVEVGSKTIGSLCGVMNWEFTITISMPKNYRGEVFRLKPKIPNFPPF